jgi:hypothetical protein
MFTLKEYLKLVGIYFPALLQDKKEDVKEGVIEDIEKIAATNYWQEQRDKYLKQK